MNQLNSIILEGNLVKDSVLSEPASGFKVCRFTIGVNRFYKNKNDEGVEEVSYFDVEAYGKTAEYCEKKAKKGRGIRVVGRLKQNVWKDSENKTQTKVFVVAEHIEYKPVYAKAEENPKESANAETKQSVQENEEAVAVF
ncbi:MAG: single-stranded DNA-binding protein [Treponema sp.]|nr:single-stranded DNA-binding protein [Treponema sp.]